MKKQFVVKKPFRDAWAVYDNKFDDWYKEKYQTKTYVVYRDARKMADKLNKMFSKRGGATERR